MAINYSTFGAGSDFHIIGKLVSAHNRERFLITDSTYGLEGDVRTDLTTDFNTSANDNKRAANAALISAVNSVRSALGAAKRSWVNRVDQWLGSSIYEGLDSRSTSIQQILEDLQADMVTNSKFVTASVGDVTMVGSPNTHVFVSKIHAGLTWANNGTVKNVEKFTDLVSEVLTFAVTSPQNSTGAASFTVYGEPRAGTANIFPDVNGGLGDLGTFTSKGWLDGSLVKTNGAENGPRSSDEIASEWRRFATTDDADDNTPYDTAPASVGWSRVTGATPVTGDCYFGSTSFKCTGDNTNKRMYLAQLIHNPNRDAKTAAWGTSINDTALSRVASTDEGKVVFVSFRYKAVPTGHTLLPKLISNGTTISADATPQAVTSDGSSTWRQAVFAFVLDKGVSVEHLIVAIELRNGGSVIPATTVAYVDVLKVEAGTVIGGLWFHGVPNHVPLGRDAKDTFTLAKTSESKWQKYFTDSYRDRFGQRVHLPSGVATEAESLIAIADA